MNKTELAESMAEFLGWKEVGDSDPRLADGEWLVKDGEYLSHETVYSQIFSPDGFFAVWDKLDEIVMGEIAMPDAISFWVDVIGKIYIQKKDRYTAFYSAVHEMRTKP